MRFHLLFASPISACFELDNESIFYSETPYDVSLDGKLVLKTQKKNVFSLYGLANDHDYCVSVGPDSVSFHTPKTSMVLHYKDFKSLNGDDTLSLQSAIEMLPPDGTLVIEAGEYHVTSIFLKSDMTLYIEKGAIIYGDIEIEHYPLCPGEYLDSDEKKVQFLSWEGAPFEGKPSLINGYYLHNVNIVGEGLIDSQAQISHFWDDVKNLKWGRPRMVFFNRCENINMQGLTIQNSPCWTIHPYFSNHLGFYDLKINNPKDAPNTDGLNPECCDGVSVIGVDFSVGDDCIALKSGKIYIGKTYKTPTQNVVIRNCHMAIGHGAIVLGSEAGAGLKNITVERCFFDHTDRGMRIKSRRGRGEDSVIDGILFKDILMENVLTPLVINMFYFCDPDGKADWVQDKNPAKLDKTTPYLGSFTFSHMNCVDCEWAFGYFYGLPEQPIGSVRIVDSSFKMKDNATKGLPAMMCGIEPTSKAGFVFHNVKNVSLENVEANGFVGEEATLDNVGSFNKI